MPAEWLAAIRASAPFMFVLVLLWMRATQTWGAWGGKNPDDPD
jgi:hypothetical protein